MLSHASVASVMPSPWGPVCSSHVGHVQPVFNQQNHGMSKYTRCFFLMMYRQNYVPGGLTKRKINGFQTMENSIGFQPENRTTVHQPTKSSIRSDNNTRHRISTIRKGNPIPLSWGSCSGNFMRVVNMFVPRTLASISMGASLLAYSFLM